MPDARTLIGPSDPKDSLRVQKIADTLPPEASALKAVLADAAVVGRDSQRLRISQEAAEAKNWAGRLDAAAVIGAGVAALASGLLLYGQGAGAAPSTDSNAWLIALVRGNHNPIVVIQILGLFFGTAATTILAGNDYGKAWTEKRRQAESLRADIFDVTMTKVAAKASEPGLLQQFLELFRRYQLDLQTRWYLSNGDIQVKTDAWLVWLAGGLAGVAAVSAAIGGLGNSNTLAPVIAAFLGIGVPILLSTIKSWRSVARAQEKAGAYKAAADALEKLGIELDNVRSAADNGDVQAVQKFVADVHGIMRTESGAFVGSGPPPPAPPARGQG